MSNLGLAQKSTFQVPHFCAQCGKAVLPSNDSLTKWVCDLGHKSYCNPVPVVVAIIPTIDDGFVMVRRAINPGQGKLAFVGGNVESNESVFEAISREVKEEIGFSTYPDQWQPHGFVSTPDNQRVLMFAKFEELAHPNYPWRVAENEVLEVEIVRHMPKDVAFPLHAEVLKSLLHE